MTSGARRAAWEAGLYLRRVAPATAVVALLCVCVGRWSPPVPPRGAPLGAAASNEEAWRTWRDRLSDASRARRDGDLERALREYERVGRASTARVRDAHVARYWHARIRVERGEASASIALHALLRETDDPALVARIASCAARRWTRDVDPDERRVLFTIACDARVALRSMSRVRTDEGRRAARWWTTFERTTAPTFFR